MPRKPFDPLAVIPSPDAIRERLSETLNLAERLRILLDVAERMRLPLTTGDMLSAPGAADNSAGKGARRG